MEGFFSLTGLGGPKKISNDRTRRKVMKNYVSKRGQLQNFPFVPGGRGGGVCVEKMAED